MAKSGGVKTAAQNRKAFHDYFVEDRYEAGIELAGTEVSPISDIRASAEYRVSLVKVAVRRSLAELSV